MAEVGKENKTPTCPEHENDVVCGSVADKMRHKSQVVHLAS